MSKYPKLYHGTSFRALEMTSEERTQMRIDCNAMIDSLWDYFGAIYSSGKITNLMAPLNYYEDQRIFHNLCNALNIISSEKNGNKQYDLGDFYVTTAEYKAVSYARSSFAFGEIGLRAYRMYEAIRELNFENWSPSDELAKSIALYAVPAAALTLGGAYIYKRRKKAKQKEEAEKKIEN